MRSGHQLLQDAPFGSLALSTHHGMLTLGNHLRDAADARALPYKAGLIETA
jgi:hypothetical protein